jgi:hypothetical protein
METDAFDGHESALWKTVAFGLCGPAVDEHGRPSEREGRDAEQAAGAR